MMKYVVKNILNTIQYMIKRYIKKVYLLIIMFLLGMLFQTNVFGYDGTAPTGYKEIKPSRIIDNVGIPRNSTVLTNFNGFKTYVFDAVPGRQYYIGIDVASSAIDVCYGFSGVTPANMSVGRGLFAAYPAYNLPFDSLWGYTLVADNPDTHSLVVCVYPSDGLGDLFKVFEYSFIGDEIANQTTVLNNSITDQTNTLNNSINNSTEQVVGTLTDSTIDDDSMSIDTSSFDTSGDAEVNNFMSSFLNTVYNAYTGITDDVITITIPLPYTDNVLTLESDLLSRYIINTPLYTLIQVFWTFVIGSYLVMFTYRIYAWLSSGKIAERGISGFISYLDEQNELIKTYMM